MIQRGLSVEKLSEVCGVKKITLSNQIAKNFPSRRLRQVVETVLNLSIWSNQDEFVTRQQLTSRCGFNPFVLTAPKLRQRIAELKLRGRSKARRKDAMIELLQQRFAITKSHQPNHP